jgi:intraflagellar transport protein 88
MKSNASAGFKSKPATKDMGGPAPPLDVSKVKSEEENFKEMEEEVHRLLEQSAENKVKKNFTEALNKAKDAAAKEKKIRQLREQNGSLD